MQYPALRYGDFYFALYSWIATIDVEKCLRYLSRYPVQCERRDTEVIIPE